MKRTGKQFNTALEGELRKGLASYFFPFVVQHEKQH